MKEKGGREKGKSREMIQQRKEFIQGEAAGELVWGLGCWRVQL